MRIPGRKTLNRNAHWLRSRLRPRAIVLGYHRIDAPSDDPFDLCTSPDLFREQLAVIRAEGLALSMAKLLEGIDTAELPRRALLVTIDDGYADSLLKAKPALDEYAIPGAVFVATDLIDAVPWWERLAAAFPIGDPGAARLTLDVDGQRFGWHERVPAARAARIQHLQQSLASWEPRLRDQAIERLANELGGARSSPESARGLTRDELRALCADGRIEVGAHGVHHSLLGVLSEAAQREEISESKRILEEVTGRPIRAFSYPNGSSTERTRELVRENGLACAFGSHSGVATPISDRYFLPRFWVGRMTPSELRKLIRFWG